MADIFDIEQPSGMAVLYSKKTNQKSLHHPVDAREILASSDDYAVRPTKTVSAADSTESVIEEVKVPIVTLADLEAMTKIELVNLAKKLKIEIPQILTAPQIKDEIIKHLNL